MTDDQIEHELFLLKIRYTGYLNKHNLLTDWPENLLENDLLNLSEDNKVDLLEFYHEFDNLMNK